MRRLLPTLLLLPLLGCGSPTPTLPPLEKVSPTPIVETAGTVPVTRVVDGDTLHLQKGSKDVTVRLLRVNTRERGEWGYKQGQDELRRLVEGKRVRVEGEDEKADRYGRDLGYLFVGPTNVNLEIVRSGWSPFFRRYGKGRYAELFQAAESEARRAKRGLWSRPDEARRNDEMAQRKPTSAKKSRR